ncbi:MAG: TRAP transporter large permease subunit, partial [Lachnospiraceae bacterium]|nr:TRAP transporter large permease subunit [Lachnospiraceae bacterium]
ALIGFTLMIILMIVLIKSWVSPPVAFIGLPLIAAVIAGFSVADIGGFIGDGMKSMLSTAVLFVFSISYFTLMDEIGLFDPIINALTKRAGKNIWMVVIALLLTTFVAHLDGSGATTFLIVVPAFLPIFKRLGMRKEALLAMICGPYAVMNILPWGGPTMRAATVAEVETSDLYAFIIPGVLCLIVCAFLNAFLITTNEKRHGLNPEESNDNSQNHSEEKSEKRTWRYWFNLVVTLIMLAFLFLDTPMPLYSIFMIAYAIVLVVNFPNTKTQNSKIKSLGQNAMVMTVALFSVGIFMGVISGTGMVEAMANTIVSVLPEAMAPHMHWFMALFSVPLMMILGTDAFYYALLPIIIGVVAPFGVAAEAVAATFLLTATYGTPVSPSVAAVYVGLGLADVSIGDHIKYALKFVWPMSILVLIGATILGVVPF